MTTFPPIPAPCREDPSWWVTQDYSLSEVIRWKWEAYKPTEKTSWDANQVCSYLQSLFHHEPQRPIVGIGNIGRVIDVEDGERRLSALGINLREVTGPEVRFDITTCRWEPGAPDEVTKISRKLMLNTDILVWKGLHDQLASRTPDPQQTLYRIMDCHLRMVDCKVPVTL